MSTQKRQSKYRRPAAEQLPSLRFEKTRDMAILNLFGPEQRFDYLTAKSIALLLDRPLGPLQRRLQKLWQLEYLGRWFPPHDYRGGSKAPSYFLDRLGAKELSAHLDQPVSPKDLDPHVHHPSLIHSVLVDEMRGIIKKALLEYDGFGMAYEYNDKGWTDKFEADRVHTTRTGKQTVIKTRYNLAPDWVFAFSAGEDSQGNPLPIRNFFLELQLSKTRAVKNPDLLRQRWKSLRHRFEGYYYYYKTDRWEHWSKKKSSLIQQPDNVRVLVVTEGMSEREFNRLIDVSRSVDHAGVGIRLFWFLRLETLADDPVNKIKDRIWQTAVEGDPLRSIFTSR